MRHFRRAIVTLAVLLLCMLCCAAAHADGGVLWLPAGTASIEEEAFCGDSALDKVILPQGIAEIGTRAFAGSSLRQINLPDSLAYDDIAGDAFDGTPLQYVIVSSYSPAGSWALDHQSALGYEIVWNNDLSAQGLYGQQRIVVPEGGAAELHTVLYAFDPIGIGFEWYVVGTDTEGNDVWTGPLAEGNGPSIVTGPIYGHERYVCRVSDAYGCRFDVWFDVMVDNALSIWPTLDEHDRNRNWLYVGQSGDSATLSVGASALDDSVLTYSWHSVEYVEGGDYWNTLAGETGTSLTTGPITGYSRFVCTVTDRYGTMNDCWFFVDVDPVVNSVTSGAAFDVGSTDAWVPLTYSVNGETVARGYRMGVLYSESADGIGVGADGRPACMDWTWGRESDVYGIANGKHYDGWLDEMIPGHTYYYSGVILDPDGYVLFLEDSVRSFTAGSGTDVQTLSLAVGSTGFAPRGDTKTPFRFTAPDAGWYEAVSDVLMAEMSVRRTDDSGCGWANNAVRVRFYAGDGETVYIFTRDWRSDAEIRVEAFTAPENDSVSSVIDLSGNYPAARVVLDISAETARQGYSFGVQFSPWEDFRDDCDYFFWFDGNEQVRANDTQSCEVTLIPGITYYYRGFINYHSGGTFLYEPDDPDRFVVGPGSVDDLPELTGEWTALSDIGETLYRFTAPAEGFYAIEADGMFWMNILNTNGAFLSCSDRTENDAGYAAIAVGLREDESVYVRVGGREGGSIRVTDPVGVIGTIDAAGTDNTLDVYSDRLFCFRAGEAGWYNLHTDRTGLQMQFYPVPGDQDISFTWNFYGGYTQSFRTQTDNETVYFLARFNMDDGPLGVSIEPVALPEEDAVVLRNPLTVGDTWAELELEYSVTEAAQELACQGWGYQVGVVYATGEIHFDEYGGWYAGEPGESFDGITEDWSWEPFFSVENGAVLTRRLDRLTPDTDYWCFAYVRDAQTGQIHAHTDVLAFRTEPASQDVVELSFGQPVSVPAPDGYADSVYRFVPDHTDMYTVVTQGLDYLDIYDGNSRWSAGSGSRNPDDAAFPYRQGFIGLQGMAYYIFVGNRHDGAPLYVGDGSELPLLTDSWPQEGERQWYDGRQVFRFTAPADGWYRFEFDGTDHGELCFGEPGNTGNNNGWPRFGEGNVVTRELEEGQTVYPGCWFDDQWAQVRMKAEAVVPATEISVATLDVTDVTDVSALFGIELGMPAPADGGNYTYGVQLRRMDDDPSFTGGEAWQNVSGDMSMVEWNQTAPREAGCRSFFDVRPLEPDTSYVYEAFVGVWDPQEQRDVFTFGGLKSFTTDPLHPDRSVREIAADEDIFLPRLDAEYQILSFTVPQQNAAELYNMWVRCSIWAITPDGSCLWPTNDGDGRTISIPGRGFEGQTYKIYVREWDWNGETTRLESFSAAEVFTGANQQLESGRVYSFTVPTDGEYLIGATDDGRICVYLPNEGGFNHGCGWGWVHEAGGSGETLLFRCERDDGNPVTEVVITPVENPVTDVDGLLAAAAAAGQIAQVRTSFEGFSIKVNDDITLTQDLELSTVAHLYLNADLTVGAGATLTAHGDIDIPDPGSRTVNGTLHVAGIQNKWWSCVRLTGGSLTVNGTVTVADDFASIAVDGSCYPGLTLQQLQALTAGVPNSGVEILVCADSDAKLDEAVALLSDDFGYRGVNVRLLSGYNVTGTALGKLEAFQDPNRTGIIADAGSCITVDADRTLTIYSALQLCGASVTVNGTMNVLGTLVFADGGEENNYAQSSFVNNGEVTAADGSTFMWVSQAVVTNNGIMNFTDNSSLYVSNNDLDQVVIDNTEGSVNLGVLAYQDGRITFDGGSVLLPYN